MSHIAPRALAQWLGPCEHGPAIVRLTRYKGGQYLPQSPEPEVLVKSDLLFDRCDLSQLDLSAVRAHGGEGLIQFARVADRSALLGGCNFIDIAELPPGTSIGSHTHAESEEELYLILAGTGVMSRNGETFPVKSGDLIRNPPGGTHSLRNTGSETLRIFVFELEVHP